MFDLNPNFYYITIILQAICVYHCVRRGKQNQWVWIIVFLPVVGSLIYLFSEVLTSGSLQKVQNGLGTILSPTGSIRQLEENLRFSDTFANRIALADAYLNNGETDKAIHLYEQSKTGAFEENEHILAQLMIAYFRKERYEEVVQLGKKLYKLAQLQRSTVHILYARALEAIGNSAEAEKEFISMKGRFSYYEARYEYGLFLVRMNREADAEKIFKEMLDEERHLSPREKRYYKEWFSKAKAQLRRLEAVQ